MTEFRQNADTRYTDRRREHTLGVGLAVGIGLALAVLLLAALAR